jgi:SAM-dependent methyltransferase
MAAVMLEIEESKLTGTKDTGAPPEAALTQLMLGGLAAQSVYVAAKLGIADLLANGPRTVKDLAEETDTHAPSLYRVLRALSSFGIFEENDGEQFALTPTASLLRSGVTGSLRDCAIFMGEDWHWEVWGKTLYSVRTGNPAWKEVHGQTVFPYFATNQKASKIFDDAMSSFTTLATTAVVEAYDFSSVRTLVDIAGGHGRLLTGILAANANMRGVLFDLPHVIAGAREGINTSELASRVELATGDFFVAVPANGDAYIMKHIIHDWDDAQALQILKNIGKAMKPDGRVLLVESVITERNKPDFGKLMDIEMLVSPGGKERTAREYEQLFARAGLTLTQIVPTNSPYSIIEARMF